MSSIQFKATILDSPIDRVYWCGGSLVVTFDDDIVRQKNDIEKDKHRKIIFILTQKGVIYRSIDYGFRWENVTEILIQKHKLNTSFKFRDLIQSPADSNVLYMQGYGGESFNTFDCGNHYTSFTHSSKIFGLRLNKMNTKQLIAFEQKSCDKSLINCKERFRRDMILSLNGGQTWDVILQQVKEANWDKLIHYEIVPDQRIIAVHLKQDGTQIVSYSDDFYKTYKVISIDAFGFFQTHQYLFILVAPDELSQAFDLEVQVAITDMVNPIKVVIPREQEKHFYTVLDASTEQIFLSVTHQDDLQKISNIYVSGSKDASKFSLSLLNNVRSIDSGACDFQRINGIPGLFIANIYHNEVVQKLKTRRHQATNEQDQKQLSTDHLEAYKKTLITFEQGSDWHQIRAPKEDQEGNPLNCNGDCSLHLRNSFNQIYSSPQAVGIIVATGNTGLYLSQKDEDMNTYLSRDGGHQWFQILKGSYIYEIGDHGGLIVLAKNKKETDRVIYTWDEGLTFDTVFLPLKKSIQIDHIVTEPSNMEQKFLIVGKQLSNQIDLIDEQVTSNDNTTSQERGIVIALDFTGLHQRECKGQWDPSTSDSDYEYWIPMNYLEQKCLLGKRTKYIRRKREAQCYNPEEMDKVEVVQNCPCTEADWECDFGYFRQIEGGECISLQNKFYDAIEINEIPTKCKGTYKKTQGYRKIAGDTCEGGIYLGPIETACPHDETQIQIDQQKIQILKVLDENKILAFIIAMILLGIFKYVIERLISNTYENQCEKHKRNYYPTNDEEEMRSGINKLNNHEEL